MNQYKKVEKHELPEVWTQVKFLIEKALATSRGEAESEHFRRSIERGQMDLFIAYKDGEVLATMVTQFIQHANYTALRVCILGGKSQGILEDCCKNYWP